MLKFRFIKLIPIVLFLGIHINTVYGQVSPPGLGKAKTASWSVLGLRRKLDSAGTKEALTYIGLGTKSTPDDSNPFHKQAIWVLNHEVYHKFAPNQQYSYALSYRRQNVYDEKIPYHNEGVEQEFRLYGRYAYTVKLNERWKWKNTLRQEFRKFFTADFHKAEENFQFRTRLKSQVNFKISDKNKQELALSAEGLFAISKLNEPDTWSSFGYKETRLGFYYMTDIPKTPLRLDVGYMNDLIKGYDQVDFGVHYLAVDLIWNLPYHKH
ncbi:DUF2490 domain-containing protein [Sphingobacterium sp. DR205]|uniref:DUF2490 domain-containing protein n=1 Tax=Sphingobacterium athyrii TaxID=2152717 RepID=A0A363NZ45_9SPHI|nr:hypothetical protein DCO56_03715 [Sphingobacterium athyrii]QIH33041.1 DUF2490 domain-containing protein [Sphingobacterium sp. DR205]